MGLPNQSALNDLRKAHEERRVLGLKGISQKAVERLDIEVFLDKSPKCFNLFILALDALKKDAGWMGYFQIAGIHGMPSLSWDGVTGKDPNPELFQGYCAHGVETFPTWHRPYLAMIEQAIYLKMLDIAATFNTPHRDDYMIEAQKFRLPYWDYYRPRDGPVEFPGVLVTDQPSKSKTQAPYDYKVPILFTENTIIVNTAPSNEPNDKFPNPLKDFSFEAFKAVNARTPANKIPGGIPDDQWIKFEKGVNSRSSAKAAFPRDRTVRYPTTAAPEGDTARLNNVMNEIRMDSNRMAMMMMEATVYSDYNVIASNRAVAATAVPTEKQDKVERKFWANPFGSLEGLHGSYHVVVGGTNGHMSEVPIAAFDPIFWFHHCQIDRLFAVWQAINAGKDKSWFNTPPSTRSKSAPQYPSPTDGLSPFRKELGDFAENCWNSNDSRTTEAFGYTYPDIRATSEQTKAGFRAKYAWSVPLAKSGSWGSPPQDMKPILPQNSPFFKREQPTGVHHMSARVSSQPSTDLEERVQAMMVPEASSEPASESGWSREWFVDDKVQRLALNGAFSILYFINEEPGSRSLGPVDDFVIKPSFAALTHIFAAPVEFCDNCGYDAEQAKTVTNSNSITSMLLDYVAVQKLQSMEPEHVLPFLTARLRWRVVDAAGGLHDPRALAAGFGLEIGISCKKARLPRGSDDVTYEEYPDVAAAIIAQASATPTA